MREVQAYDWRLEESTYTALWDVVHLWARGLAGEGWAGRGSGGEGGGDECGEVHFGSLRSKLPVFCWKSWRSLCREVLDLGAEKLRKRETEACGSQGLFMLFHHSDPPFSK
jgi:hypothetical protein